MIRKKPLIIGSLIFVLLIILIFVFYFIRENRHVTFAISYPEGTAVISDSPDPSRKFATIKNNSSLWLSKKTYYVFFENDKLDKNPITVTVDDQTGTLTLDPNFSQEVLTEMLSGEQKGINTAIETTVTSTVPYTLEKGTLYHQGEWYGTQLRIYQASSEDPEIGNPDNADSYFVVLKKENGTWKIVAGPSLILTKPDNPTIPSYIIEDLNPVNATTAIF